MFKDEFRTDRRRLRSGPRPAELRVAGRDRVSAAEEDLQHVAILHLVGLALGAEAARLPRLGHRAELEQVLVGHGLGADEALREVGVDRPGSIDRGRPVRDRPGADLVGPAVRNETSPSSRYDSSMTRSRLDSVIPSSSMNTPASSGSSSPSSISILAESASTSACSMAIAAADPLDQRRSACQIALADVEQHEDRLLGQEPEPADRLRVVIVETEVADRRAGLEPLVDPSDDDLLALGGLALGRRPVAAARPGAAPVGARPSPGRRAMNSRSSCSRSRAGSTDPGRVRVRGIVERPDDVQQRVGLPEPGEVVRRQLLGPDPALRTTPAAPAGRRT